MPRARNTVEKMAQSTITEYFSVRKTRKRTADNLKDKEILFQSPTPKKSLVLKSDLISRKKKKVSQSSSSSRLLASVLNKNAELKAVSKKFLLKENNNPNVKNAFKSENIELNSTKDEAMETDSSTTNEVVLPKEKLLEENDESSSKEVETKVASVNKKIKVNEPLIKEKEIQNETSKTLQIHDVPVKKLSKCVNPKNKDISETINTLEVSLLKSTTFRTKPDQSTKSLIINTQTAKSVLPLPSHYKFLGQIFTCIDRVALMLFNRDEDITFKKLQPALQNMSDQEVTLDHLAQIKTIYPEAFSYQYKYLRTSGSESIILTPNFESPKISDGKSVLHKRKLKFYNTLLDRVKDEHEKFLLECKKSEPLLPKDKIKRWHPQFEIEKCKFIEKTELTTRHIIKLTSPKEVLEKVKECCKIDTNLKNSTGFSEIVSKPMEMKQNKQAEDYCRLPSLAKRLHNIFLSEKKNVLALNVVVEKVQFSSDEKLSLDEIEKKLRLLCKLVPQWINLFNLGKSDRLKIDKKVSFQKVSKILQALARRN